jgi:hypothetical protein
MQNKKIPLIIWNMKVQIYYIGSTVHRTFTATWHNTILLLKSNNGKQIKYL